MAKTVMLKNQMNEMKKGFVGFSWTTFFFSFLVAAFRKDLKWAGIMFGVNMVFAMFNRALNLPEDPSFITTTQMQSLLLLFVLQLGVGIIFARMYNRQYTQKLLNTGFMPADAESEALLEQYHFVFQSKKEDQNTPEKSQIFMP